MRNTTLFLQLEIVNRIGVGATVICQQIFSILALVIFLLQFLLKSASTLNIVFFRFGVEIPGFGTAISDAIARNSFVFCNSVSSGRIEVAASRLLGDAAACVILLCFAAGHRKSYWNGCIKAAIVICYRIFSIFGASNFPFQMPFKKCFKIVFFRFGVEIRFWSCNELQFLL